MVGAGSAALEAPVTHSAVRAIKSLRGGIVPLLLLGCWEYNAHRDALHSYAFVPLEQVGAALYELLANGDLWLNLKGSLLRTSLGLATGVALGIGTGVLMAFSRVALTLINPLYQSIRQVPLLGLTPLIGLWLGNGEPAKVFIIALAAFYPMVLSTYEGLRNVEARYREVGQVYGLNRIQSFRRVLLPAALPSLFAGLQQAVPFTWIVAVAGELLFNVGAGLGNLMMVAETGAHMDVIMVCTAAITALGFAMSQLVSLLSAHVLRWRQ
jgi:sulfonate transport system permease protein